MSNTLQTQLLIIGGGPGGYIAGIRAGQLGVKTIVVEGVNPGGTCLNIGCIPSKALIHAAEEFAKVTAYAAGTSPLGISVQAPSLDLAKTVAWKAGIVKKLTGGVSALLKKNGAQLIKGWATIVDGKTVEIAGAAEDGGTLRITCEHLLLATGSVPVELPFLPFGGKVISSTEALSPTSLPKQLIVVGGGYIGLELGTVYRKLGCEVTVVEAQERILPAYDAELTKPVATQLEKSGVKLLTGHSVLGLADNGQLRVRDAGGTEIALDADQILVAVGRRPKTDGFNLESLQLDLTGKAIKIDDQCKTSMRNVWAIGDVAGERCSRIGRWRRANWWPRSSAARSATSCRPRFRRCASPTRKSWWSGCRRTKPRRRASRPRSRCSRSRPMAVRCRWNPPMASCASSRAAATTASSAGRPSACRSRSCRLLSCSPSRWAPRWRTSPGPSIRTRRWVRRRRKRRCVRWGMRCISDASARRC
ncbi:FAD-dependent oxidoreductase [Stenotrophomonas rhizophila]